MPLFEVAIIETPTVKEEEEGKVERLVLPPKAVIASDAQSAAVVAVMEVGTIDIKKERMKILVRPFG